MRVLVSGSSGLIGTALCAELTRRGHTPIRLVRRRPHAGEAEWDPANGTIDRDAVASADAVVNLAGAGIGDKRWTDEYKRQLVDSRIKGTTLLATTITELAADATGPGVLLNGSAIGVYGDRGDEELTEESPVGSGFLADLCVQWEHAATQVPDTVRATQLRTGIVLSRNGGALKKQLPLFKLGLGGHFGSGKPWQSWISLTDHVAATIHLLTAATVGPVNLTAPHPVRGRTFADTLGSVLHRPSLLPVPAFGPKLLLGSELATNLLFSGQKVMPSALVASGFVFQHPTLAEALRAELGRS